MRKALPFALPAPGHFCRPCTQCARPTEHPDVLGAGFGVRRRQPPLAGVSSRRDVTFAVPTSVLRKAVHSRYFPDLMFS